MCAIDGFVFCLVSCELYFIFLNCALTPFLDSALWLIAKVAPALTLAILYACFDSHMCMIILASLDLLINCHDCFISLVETRF